MKAKKILAAVAATTLLFSMGAQMAGADEGKQDPKPTITIDVAGGNHKGAELTQGKPFVVKTMCASTDKGYQLRIGDRVVANGTVEQGANGVEVLAGPAQVGKQTLTAMCSSYNGADTTAAMDVTIKSVLLFIEPTSWKAGDEITIKGFGFAPGESVSLDMVREADGKSYWKQDNAAVADANGALTHKLVLKSDVPQGSYKLIAKGTKSDLSLTASFYWGRPDSDTKKPGDGSTGGSVGKNKGGKKAGLPRTGA